MAKKTNSGDSLNLGNDPSGFNELANPGRDLGSIIKAFVALAAIALFAIFAIQNSESVDVSFLMWDFSIPLIFLLIISVLIGIIALQLFSFVRRRRT